MAICRLRRRPYLDPNRPTVHNRRNIGSAAAMAAAGGIALGTKDG